MVEMVVLFLSMQGQLVAIAQPLVAVTLRIVMMPILTPVLKKRQALGKALSSLTMSLRMIVFFQGWMQSKAKTHGRFSLWEKSRKFQSKDARWRSLLR